MSHLKLSLLGPFQVLKDGHPINSFLYDKVRLLLAYLVAEAQTVHHRSSLAVLLWADQSEQNARNNLRKALLTLRQTLNDRDPNCPFLLTTRNTIQVNAEYNYTSDLANFNTYLSAAYTSDCTVRLKQAIALYRGNFLSNLPLPDSEEFESWMIAARGRLHLQAIEACTSLTDYFENQQDWNQAKRYAKQQLELEPWSELAHQALMRIFAKEGHRSAALIQYEQCCKILSTRFEVEPDFATVRLYQQIQSGCFA